MSEVIIYTRVGCYFCDAARDLLRRKGVDFRDIDISGHRERRSEMIDKAGGRTTVPQIFIGGTHIGGCDDLHALDRSGKLDPMLAGAEAAAS